MRLTEAAERPPKKCVVSGSEKGPFVDFQVEVRAPDPNLPNFLYVRAGVVEEAAKLLGMVPKREVDNLTDQLHALSEELKDLRESMELYGELEERVRERSAA